ncbi:ABC transporter permease [Stenomitos frigidus]|uniref:Peptide ABC transporter permease n=1 Tax=Stenomitos frigidus ULC18 TaxID=2107698 RepID=A0A2T1E2T7_9CYAN|nr:ABC transporter permease [Stenomitos frigidus]PSB27021.1 peptide ABC transporter permease [Stenomitos frigidus ULC18]
MAFSLPQLFRFADRPTLSTRMTQVGLVITIFFVGLAMLAPMLQSIGWLQDPTEFLANPIQEPPSLGHWFGTTRLGYDVLSRTVFGSQAALQVVILATMLSLVIGVPLGMVSGYLGGRLDRLLLFLMDTIYTLPGLLLSVTLAFVVGRGVLNAAIALSIAYVPQYYRVVRNHTVSVKTELFVEAAQAMGASTWAILSRYLFLNVVQSVPVLFTLNAADAILTLGGLGFLGLGLPEETAEWGYDLRQALDGLSTGGIWWTTLFPGLAMTVMVVGLSLLGEGLNDWINPTLRVQSSDTSGLKPSEEG